MRRCVLSKARPSVFQDEHDATVAVVADKTLRTHVVAIFGSDALHGVAVNARKHCKECRDDNATVDGGTPGTTVL